LTTDTTSSVVASARLYYRDGSSDKEYHAAINSLDDGYTVTFAFGRRGGALNAGTKTTSPVTLEKARQIYDRLIAEKTAKGYTPDGSGAVFASTDYEKRVSGLVPQLLNAIEESAARRHLDDDAWCMQEKFDGKRIMTKVAGGQAEGSNRKGLSVPLLQEIATALASLPDCVLDGEMVGDAYMVFDLLSLGDDDLRQRPYHERYQSLLDTIAGSSTVVVADTAWDQAAKETLYARIASAGGEGVVFKRVDGVSVAGRPASGASQVKCKFYATCTCIVARQNDQRSVHLHLVTDSGATVDVGNVTVPISKPIPQPGATVEIRYLYAYKGGSLYQPIYLGERDDLSPPDCTIAQLKYKPDGYAAEEE
jgi:bifunctional non-homologous end joining protein LigD